MGLASLRQRYLTHPLYDWFNKVLPPLSETEQVAMQSGSVWWEAELFKGSPDWQKLHAIPKPTLSEQEQHFIDTKLPALLRMLDDFDIVQQQQALSPQLWKYLKKEQFLALIIPKQYGGLAFSALANATIVAKIASKSLSAAVSVMVPNSLGPGELLSHYGTDEQKQYWLPRLAAGDDIPCFALTEPHAGSDAGSITSQGEICLGQHQGQEVLGIKLNWHKRYITLAPIATVLGLAFQLSDPNKLLGERKQLGITCALIPTDHSGVSIGERHNPLGLGFMNGPTTGKEVFIPLDWVVGGKAQLGNGWQMLMACLSAGRGISLPALATAIAQLSARTSGAYAFVREQFGTPIGKFEGVANRLGKIGGLTYLVEAMRSLTTTGIDQGEKPAIVTAMTKYHCTELARIILNDAMDIHAGRAIQLGELNYLANHYIALPVAITVEGANILTRNLIIFGQGAIRCHPYVLDEMQAAADPDEQQGKQAFDKLLTKHILFTGKNTLLAFVNAISRSFFNQAPVADQTARYYRDLARFSRALSVAADMSMLTLGGSLKKKELLSARLGDILSHLYMGSAVLKRYQNEGRPPQDLPLVHYAMQHCLYQCAQSFSNFLANFPHKYIAISLKLLLFPLGFHYRKPTDALCIEIAELLMADNESRDRLCALSHFEPDGKDAVGIMEMAFVAKHQARPAWQKLTKAVKDGQLEPAPLSELSAKAIEQDILTFAEAEQIQSANEHIEQAIAVNSFSANWFSHQPKKARKTKQKLAEKRKKSTENI